MKTTFSLVILLALPPAINAAGIKNAPRSALARSESAVWMLAKAEQANAEDHTEARTEAARKDTLVQRSTGASVQASNVRRSVPTSMAYTVFDKGKAGRGSGRTLLLNFAPKEDAVMAELEEDLTVMARILEKALEEEEVKGGPATRLGVVIQSFGTDRLQSLYLEGYGALFFLSAKVPLLPGPPGEEAKPEPAASSTWDATRQELYGGPGRFPASLGSAEPAAPYDEQLVERLKTKLLQALQQAKHLRHVQPDEYIAIVLLGEPSATSAETSTSGGLGAYGIGGGGGSYGGAGVAIATDRTLADEHYREAVRSQAIHQRQLGRPGWEPLMGDSRVGTTLTIRAKKKDVDDFGAGKRTLEEFRKKTAINTYVGNALSGTYMEWLTTR